ncbi:MAG: hypothetical protein MZV63_15535 [Marinilabiliales bacterium]|nr:hypothetical protein [Marinilabiliales bacterium]
MSRAITPSFFGSWMDVRYPLIAIEEATGLPTFRLYRKLSEGEHSKKFEHSEKM